MAGPVIAVFCMPEDGHFQLLRPLIAGLARRFTVRVLTHRRFAPSVTGAGATFVDLFLRYPLASADDESFPIPCRYVSFAGHYAEAVAREVERLQPSLIVSETFSVVGRAVAGVLGVPWVNVCPGHDVQPEWFVRQVGSDPRVRIAPSCHRAVEALRDRCGMSDASPFSFVTALSPFLNVYCEPPAFLEAASRRAFEPVVFFGSLTSLEERQQPAGQADASSLFVGPNPLKAYVSFGTVVWRYYAKEALAALQAVSACVGARPDSQALISLGGATVDRAARRGLVRPNVAVADYVEQRTVLREASVFVTHHGINSTHEAIFNRVPMISYPFFWDQPALAAKCQELGLAVALTSALRGPVTEKDVHAALEALLRESAALRARLERARDQELDVIAGREAIFRRIELLTGTAAADRRGREAATPIP